jgi:hypothetical protein
MPSLGTADAELAWKRISTSCGCTRVKKTASPKLCNIAALAVLAEAIKIDPITATAVSPAAMEGEKAPMPLFDPCDVERVPRGSTTEPRGRGGRCSLRSVARPEHHRSRHAVCRFQKSR